jgi:serine/threonine protein kinase
MSPDCPTPDALLRVFAGDRPPDNSRVLLRHVEDCPACRARVAALPLSFRPHPAFVSDRPDRPTPVADPWAVPQTVDLGSVELASATDNVGDAIEVLTHPVEPPPRRVGHYEVVGTLGRGGMGVVLKAIDPGLSRFVALKMLSRHLAAHEAYRRRFVREARAAARIGSDYVTAVYGSGEDDGLPFIVMEYVTGEDLNARLGREPFAPPEAVRIARQVAAGLAAAHAVGVVHRDIKPANVLLEEVRDPDAAAAVRAKLTDFGISRATGVPGITSAQETMGTPEYMSPEQVTASPSDHRTDLYSLGVLLYRMLAGRTPFVAKNAAGYFVQHMQAPPPRPSEFVAGGLPDWLEDLVLRLLRKNPDDRPASAAEVVRALDDGLAKTAGAPADAEGRRLEVLRAYRVLDTGPEEAFDDLTFLASHVCGTPIALVSLVDADRQWFKSRVGLSVAQTARNISFCQYTIRGKVPFIVGNATEDPRFANNPLVQSDPSIRFYAGVPLVCPEGEAVGSLCVIDRVARSMSSDQIAALGALARLVVNQLCVRRELAAVKGGAAT